MELPVEATLSMKPFQDQTEVYSLLKSHGFKVTSLDADKVRVKGTFMDLQVVKIHLEQLMATKTLGASPPDQEGSVRSRDEVIVVDVDVFRYARLLRKKELDEALKGPVKMCPQNTGESITITLSGKNSREAGSKLKRLLDDLNKSLRTQDILLSNLSPQGKHLLKKIKKSGEISGPNLVWCTDDMVHIIGPPRESFELKQELQVNQIENSGKSVRDKRKGRSLSLRNPFRKKSRKDVREVYHFPADVAAGPPPLDRVPAAPRQSASQKRRRSRETQEKKKAGRIEDQEVEVGPPNQKNNFLGRLRSFFKKSRGSRQDGN